MTLLRTASRVRFAALGLVLATLPASQAVAAPACAPNDCVDVLITMFNPLSDGTVYIGTDGPVSTLQCSFVRGTLMTLPAASNERLVAFLMTAYFQKTRVALRIAENSSGCNILYA